jgi:LmbE family N-acetylglucosaminyl deacetylase
MTTQNLKKTVLGIYPHPDDAEILCSGTLSLLKKSGWDVHIATMAKGDKGTYDYSRDEISRIRKSEAVNAAESIGATYHCLEFEDVYVLYNKETINETTSLIRRIKPTIVFTASPNDYMFDHEITSQIVQTACFACGIVNMEVREEPYFFTPYLYYCDPVEGMDKFGKQIVPSVYVDITSEIQLKEKALSCHKSQEHWLLNHQWSDYIDSMKRFARKRGAEVNKKYAEGFRQHLGHGFPQNNILRDILGEMVIGKMSPKPAGKTSF